MKRAKVGVLIVLKVTNCVKNDNLNVNNLIIIALAEPVIHDALTKAPEKSHFIHVDVGERA